MTENIQTNTGYPLNLFFENFIHDMNTPISIIHSVLQLLEDDSEMPAGCYRSLTIAQRNCLLLLKLANDFKMCLNLSTGNMYPSFRKHDIVLLLHDIVESASRLAVRKNISITLDDGQVDRAIVLDMEMLQRIILNLLSNAIKFTPNNGTIHISLVDSGDLLLIHVLDSGIGIDESEIGSIFDRYQTNNKTINKHGTGIGLAIVKSLVAIHGGHVTAKNRADAPGACFTVELSRTLLEAVCAEDGFYEDMYSENIIQIELSDVMI